MEEVSIPSDQSEVRHLKSIDGGIDSSEPLKPYVAKHNCRYDCSFLDHPLLHKQAAEEIAYTIALRMTRLARQKGNRLHPHFRFHRKFFGWLFQYLGSDKSTHFKVSVKKSLAAGEMPLRDDWQMVVDAFRSVAVRSKGNPFINTENKLSKHNIIHRIGSLLNLCSTRGIFPVFILRGIKHAQKHCCKRRCLGDLKHRYISEMDVERLIGGYLQDSANEHDIIKEEHNACIHALASSGLDITGLNDAEIIEAIKRFNQERLDELRRCAEIEFYRGWDVYQEGQRLLEECDLSYEDDMRGPLEDLVDGLKRGINPGSLWSRNHPARELLYGELKSTKIPLNYWKGKTVDRVQTQNKRQRLPCKVQLARLLTVIDGRYGMPVPRKFYESAIRKAVRNSYNRHAHANKFWSRDYLAINTDTMLAAQIILLIDTGLNTEVVDQLTVDCVKDTDNPTIKIVYGWKKRGGKEVKAYVRTNDPAHRISAIEVISRVKEMTKRFRKVAAAGTHPFCNVKLDEPKLAEKLFIRDSPFAVGNIIYLVAGLFSIQVNIIPNFKKRYPSVGAYDFTLTSIRPTVALLDFLQGRNIETMKARMDHKSINVTSGYVVRAASRMVMEQQIRAFQKDLEAMIIFDIPGAAEKLGYTAEEYNERLARAERTGLGTICDHIRKGVDGQYFSKKRRNCDPIEDCPECPLMRVFPALKENLVDTFLTRNWIRQNEGELRSNNPARWEKVWLRWLAIVEGVIDKAKTSHVVSRTTLNEAEELARQFGTDIFLPLI
ncbi:hypothetical protein GPEL0_01f0420 [Geoanaerobacter pelophilus]|uniref:Phage integrase family protein n=1 Tax=Geoanaerobacter pelophilus TaxID=60036 RepID=A0ABQ0MFF1_9BACT|nr:hypothetical protein [Geoanaerobacter pelophilus]GAW65502.1 hypothetical protein GPEL0_01f0420 [Geoanaerobacter pelophilus]